MPDRSGISGRIAINSAWMPFLLVGGDSRDRGFNTIMPNTRASAVIGCPITVV
jgi:hypothetical protein